MSQPAKKVQLTPFAAALAGALGGCFSTAIVYPMDVAKTRIQANSEKLSMFALLYRILRKEDGLKGWYRGFMATMINTFSQQYAYFFFYSFVRTSYLKARKTARLSVGAELLLGAIAGALAQIFTIPVSVIATRQQVGRPASLEAKRAAEGKTSSDDDDSFMSVAKEIVDEEGITGLWTGLRPGLVLTSNPAITYGLFEYVKGAVTALSASGGATSMTAWQTFTTGALSKSLATVVTYPYIMAKVRLQARTADDLYHSEQEANYHPHEAHEKHHATRDSRHPGALDVLGHVWKKEGFVGWYQGMSAQITKAVISQALLFLSKDYFEQWAVVLLQLASKS